MAGQKISAEFLFFFILSKSVDLLDLFMEKFSSNLPTFFLLEGNIPAGRCVLVDLGIVHLERFLATGMHLYIQRLLHVFNLEKCYTYF